MIARIKNILRRLTGVSTLWGGVSWSPPEPDPTDQMAREYLTKCSISDVGFRVPLIIQVGAATLHGNSQLLVLCKEIEMRGQTHPFAAWFRQGLEEHECLDFTKWQLMTQQGLCVVQTDKERRRIVEVFRLSIGVAACKSSPREISEK